ncbi:hypothetical protein BC936DRAFT_150174 [Jimgerdemannia flammicorona]|uniref:Hyaluronan/mRNA-binding protein domain-containing protein n=1 Tax=Jimgerdemannia flammicorona TaxID=994334 RepID=A0A433DJJ8_9FUNG|nr:hypothetical protein BC936DRAFT_150174 [Jimgerdemannia flammicorona]
MTKSHPHSPARKVVNREKHVPRSGYRGLPKKAGHGNHNWGAVGDEVGELARHHPYYEEFPDHEELERVTEVMTPSWNKVQVGFVSRGTPGLQSNRLVSFYHSFRIETTRVTPSPLFQVLSPEQFEALHHQTDKSRAEISFVMSSDTTESDVGDMPAEIPNDE